MTSTWSEHLAWRDGTEFSLLMRKHETTGRPLGNEDFVKEVVELLSRDLLPKKRGLKGPRKKRRRSRKR